MEGLAAGPVAGADTLEFTVGAATHLAPGGFSSHEDFKLFIRVIQISLHDADDGLVPGTGLCALGPDT